MDFITTNTMVIFKYVPETADKPWVWNELQTHSTVKIPKVFYFDISDLLNHPSTNQDFDNYIYEFKFGALEVIIFSYHAIY